MKIDESRLNEIEAMLAWRADARRLRGQICASGGVRIDQPKPEEFQVCDECEKLKGDHHGVCPTQIETSVERRDVWAAYLARWSLRYPCSLRLEAVLQPVDGGAYLRIDTSYPDETDVRDDSKRPPPTSGLWPNSMYPDENTPRWLRANILYHLGHELDERLLFDGERVFDPHHVSVYVCENCIARDRLHDAVKELIEAARG